jgi:hypothetical protein
MLGINSGKCNRRVMAQYGTWVPYAGSEAVFLGVGLLVIAVILAYLGMKFKRSVGVRTPGKTVSFFLVLMWVLSLATVAIASSIYVLQAYQEHLLGTTPTNPITPVTGISGIVTFLIITMACSARKHGLKVALGSAFVGTAAAMIFELPFDLIIMNRTFPPIPPSPIYFRLLVFLPLFLAEISTFSLLTLSPVLKLSKFTLFSLAAMFFVFAVWAFFGFSYPSDPLPIAFNTISKILSFVIAITLFVKSDKEVK